MSVSCVKLKNQKYDLRSQESTDSRGRLITGEIRYLLCSLLNCRMSLCSFASVCVCARVCVCTCVCVRAAAMAVSCSSFHQDEVEMLEGVLAFKKKTIAEVMTPKAKMFLLADNTVLNGKTLRLIQVSCRYGD